MVELGAAAVTGNRDGNQTLARGLRVMLAIADSRQGLSVLEVSEMLGVHRSIAYRLLQTLTDFGLAARSRDGVYLAGARLATLSDSYLPGLRGIAAPVMREVADALESTVLLFVPQGSHAVAIAQVEPETAPHHIAFRPGMRVPLDRGAPGIALLAADAPAPDEPDAVARARALGFARSHGELQPGAFAVASWIDLGVHRGRACLAIITYRESIADGAGNALRVAAEQITRASEGQAAESR